MTWRNAARAPHPIASPFSTEPRDTPAWIQHYFYMSAEEFIWKFSRGRADDFFRPTLPAVNVPEGFAEAFVRQHGDPAALPDDRIAKCADGMPPEIARLLSCPGVAESHAAVVAYYRKRSDELAGVVLDARNNTTSPWMLAFLDLLAPA